MRNLCENCFLDFAKAFDLINHEKLLVKLKANDVPPHILRWMGSFLLDRRQQVKIDKTVSFVEKPNGGVPQGTVSGHSNFIMFIIDLAKIAPIYKHGDDSTIFEVCHEGDNTQMQKSVDMDGIWTNQNDMRLKAKMYAIASDTHQLQFLELHHLNLERFESI